MTKFMWKCWSSSMNNHRIHKTNTRIRIKRKKLKEIKIQLNKLPCNVVIVSSGLWPYWLTDEFFDRIGLCETIQKMKENIYFTCYNQHKEMVYYKSDLCIFNTYDCGDIKFNFEKYICDQENLVNPNEKVKTEIILEKYQFEIKFDLNLF